jgi:EAL domain-containing protein (putative c-di-GMP-specific phosphodiesterase class I)
MPRAPRWAPEEADTAENALYSHNASGVHTSATSPAPYIEELERANRLVGSIPLDELGTDFQPIVNLISGETVGYEALARCGGEGLTEPSDLFARAALEKKVGELGRAIRAIAVRDCPGKPLYVPLHPSELRDRFLVQPDDPIFTHDAPMFLELAQPLLSGVALQVIRELGSRSSVALAIDDFGVGPATLKQLVELQPAAVKLDSELIAGLDQSRRKQVVVRALVQLCEQLGAQLIAKGIDCTAEAEAAAACGVVLGQGYVLGEPSPLPAISIWPPPED